MYFVEHKYAEDPTNWWIPNRACAEAMLRSAGFQITAHPEEEVFICRAVSNDERASLVMGFRSIGITGRFTNGRTSSPRFAR